MEIDDSKEIGITEEFFKRRFPDRNIEFEKKCGYFYEWVERLKKMDSISLKVWKEMLIEEVEKIQVKEDSITEVADSMEVD